MFVLILVLACSLVLTLLVASGVYLYFSSPSGRPSRSLEKEKPKNFKETYRKNLKKLILEQDDSLKPTSWFVKLFKPEARISERVDTEIDNALRGIDNDGKSKCVFFSVHPNTIESVGGSLTLSFLSDFKKTGCQIGEPEIKKIINGNSTEIQVFITTKPSS